MGQKGRLLLSRLVTALMLLSSGPLVAQGSQSQTVESAQEFLKQVISTSPQYPYKPDGGRELTKPSYLRVQSDAPCMTTFIRDVGTPSEYSWTADWSKVTSINEDHKRHAVYYHLRGATGIMGFDLDSNDMVARVAYAMEFLRAECDTTKDTGF